MIIVISFNIIEKHRKGGVYEKININYLFNVFGDWL